MKITDMQIIKLSPPTDEWMMVVIETDQGISGWGEVTGSCDNNGLAGILAEMGKGLIGKNPLHIKECTKALRAWSYPTLRTIRTYAAALSGMDQALWDLTAKYYKIPLYKLYGADGKTEIPLYANLNKAIRTKREPEVLQEQGKKALAAGFSVVKCTPFDEITTCNGDNDFGPAYGRIEALLQVIPIEQVALDCHQRFTGYTLGRMVEHITKRYGIPYWIEDPVETSDLITMKCMRQKYPFVRWAAGEDAFTIQQMMNVVNSGCYDVIMPDIKYIGGPSTVQALLPVAEECGKKATLHNPDGIIGTAHSAHASAILENGLPMEYPFDAVKDREEKSLQKECVKNGRYVLNDEPGIGVSISEQALKEYGQSFFENHWEDYHGE